MKNERYKMIKIMNELVWFYIRLGDNNVSVDLDITDTEGIVTLRGSSSCNLDQATLRELDSAINSPRKDETEEYYWNLMGANDFSEIPLLGSMVNEGTIECKGDDLVIQVKRKF